MTAGAWARMVCYALAVSLAGAGYTGNWLAGGGAGWAAAQEGEGDEAATRQYAAAAALQNREQYELAAEEWTSFLDKFPDDPRRSHARHYLGICQLKNQEHEAALETFRKLVGDDPKFELIASARLHLGLAQYNLALAGREEMYPEAERAFAALVDESPGAKEVPQALFYWGESLYAQEKKDQAARRYAQLVEKHPDDPLAAEALYALGVAQEELGQPQAAGAAYDAYLKRFGKEPLANEVLLRRGETLLALGQWEAAGRFFAAAASKPGFALADLAALRQATCLYEQQKYGEAAALYAAVPKRFPDSKHVPAARLAAGKCFYLAGNYDQAREPLSQLAGQQDEVGAQAAHWLARSFLKQGQAAEALKVAEGAVTGAAAGAHGVPLQMDLADALYELPQRRRESIARYKALAEQHPEHELAPQALYMAGFASQALGEHRAALGYAVKFLRQYGSHKLAADVMYVAAESYLQLGEYADAEGLFDELVRRYPQHGDRQLWQVRRALALSLAGNHDETVAVVQPLIASLSDPESLAEAHHLLGTSFNELGRHEAAAESLRASLGAKADWRQADETLLALAHAYRQLNDLESARKQLDELIRRFPESRALDRAHFRLAEYAFAAGDYAAASSGYQLVAERFPESPLVPHAVYGTGWTQLTRQDYAAAAETLDRLLAGQPPAALESKAHYARALARQQLEQYGPAIDDLNAFLASRPTAAEGADARYVLGLCQVGLDKHAEAAATFRQLLSSNPGYAGADKVRYELAWALKSQKLEAEAAEVFRELAQKHGQSPLAGESLYHAGEFEYGRGEFPKAARAYYDAMQAAGKSELGEKAAHKLGWSYFRQELFDKALQAFNYQRGTYPQGSLAADAAFMSAEVLFKQGKHEAALEAYEQVQAQSQPPSGQDFAVLALLHAGQAAGKLNDWSKSLELLERAARDHEQTPYLPEIVYEQAWALQNLGRLDEALKLYERVTSQTDREVAARARFMVGEIHFEKKEHAEAVRNFFKVAYGYAYPEWQANAHYEAGRCFEVLAKPKQARQSYQEVVEKFPQSSKALLAKERLAALKSE